MHAVSYATSAEMAAEVGRSRATQANREPMLRVIRNHRRAAYNAPKDEYEGLTITPVGIDARSLPGLPAPGGSPARCDRMVELGEKHGYRNAQVTCIAPTGTIALVMDCDTTGIEPDFALVKFKKLAGGGYFKIINDSIPPALTASATRREQIEDIVRYCRGTGTLHGCPHINAASLRGQGLPRRCAPAHRRPCCRASSSCRSPSIAGPSATTFCIGKLGFSKEQIDRPSFDLLTALGFSREQIAEANAYRLRHHDHRGGAAPQSGTPVRSSTAPTSAASTGSASCPPSRTSA